MYVSHTLSLSPPFCFQAPNFKGRIAKRAISALRAAGALNVLLPPEVVQGGAGQDQGLQVLPNNKRQSKLGSGLGFIHSV